MRAGCETTSTSRGENQRKRGQEKVVGAAGSVVEW